jgi:manganese transport protein
VISQVVLSIALPVPMIALVVLSRSRRVMGAMRTGPGMFAFAVLATSAVMLLNAVLLMQSIGVTG